MTEKEKKNLQRIDYSSLPGICSQPPVAFRGSILYQSGSGFSKEGALIMSGKILSSFVECTPARKHLLKYGRRVVRDGIIWQFVCTEHEKAECDICIV